eukprot:scpid75257/ scgid34794/ Probable alpha-ketoglutarate-dependent hypophosphite dioxygenase
MCSQEQLTQYAEEGYVVLSDVYSQDEISECQREYDAMFERAQKRGNDLEATWKGDYSEKKQDSSVLSIHNVQFHSSTFMKMMLNEKLGVALEQLMDTPNIQLHHTKAHVKPALKGSPFPTHQDYQYFPHENHSMIAVMVHLEDAAEVNGCICAYPKSHKLGPLPDHGEGKHHYCDQSEYPVAKATPIPVKQGEVLVFPYFLVHGSYPNKSSTPRRILLFQLREAGDEPTSAIHLSPGMGLMIRGINPAMDADINKRHQKDSDDTAAEPSAKRAM